MNPLLRFNLFSAAFMLLTLMFSSSCSKKTEDPLPTTGSLSGTVSPANALTAVTATDSGGLTFTTRPVAGTGAFSFSDLKPGNYVLAFTPASNYMAPANRTITVVASKMTAVDTVNVVGNGILHGTMTWDMDGNTYTATLVNGLISNQSFLLEGRATVGATTHTVSLFIRNGVRATRAHLDLTDYPAPPDGASAGYGLTANGVTTGYRTALVITSRTTALYGSGDITINQYNFVNQSIRGTFNFNAFTLDIAGNPRVNISNGRFDVRY